MVRVMKKYMELGVVMIIRIDKYVLHQEIKKEERKAFAVI